MIILFVTCLNLFLTRHLQGDDGLTAAPGHWWNGLEPTFLVYPTPVREAIVYPFGKLSVRCMKEILLPCRALIFADREDIQILAGRKEIQDPQSLIRYLEIRS